jgi:hypothetical protein
MDKNEVDESLIEATIRRVAEQAARADDAPAARPPDAEPAPAAEARADWPPPEVAAAPDDAPEDTPPPAGDPFAHPVGRQSADESAIEAAIRRVQAAKEEREHEPVVAEYEDGARSISCRCTGRCSASTASAICRC